MKLNEYLNKGSFNRLFIFVLFGSTILPMLPIWTSFILILSLMVINQNISILSCTHLYRKVVNIVLIVFCLFILVSSVGYLYSNPKQIVLGLFNINGIGFGFISSVALVFLLLIQFLLLMKIAIKLSGGRLKLLAYGLVLFALILVVKLLFNPMVFDDVYINMLDGVSRWMFYLNFSCCCLIILLKGLNDDLILKVITLSILAQSIIVCSQYFLGDYSYVIESLNYNEYFYRVRGTYYYHASASMFIGLGFFVALYNFRTISRNYGWLIPIVILLALYLNSTRAISLAMTCSSFLAFILIVFNRIKNGSGNEVFKFKFEMVILLISMLIFSISIFYEKNDQGSVHNEEVGIEEMAESNSARIELLSSIVNGLDGNFLLGQGMGAVKVKLNGNNLNGELETYSSHSIFVDVFLATGILGGFIFLCFYVAPLFIFMTLFFRRKCFNLKSIFLISTLSYFFITGFFFPQERNMTIMLSMILVLITIYDLHRNGKEWH